jgi:multidrug resistance efflux pump
MPKKPPSGTLVPLPTRCRRWRPPRGPGRAEGGAHDAQQGAGCRKAAHKTSLEPWPARRGAGRRAARGERHRARGGGPGGWRRSEARAKAEADLADAEAALKEGRGRAKALEDALDEKTGELRPAGRGAQAEADKDDHAPRG